MSIASLGRMESEREGRNAESRAFLLDDGRGGGGGSLSGRAPLWTKTRQEETQESAVSHAAGFFFLPIKYEKSYLAC